MYHELKESIEQLMNSETNFIANAANFSAVLYNGLEDINWVGFYLLSENVLILGPFQGKPACLRINIGKGVCGVSAKNRQPIIVDDVNNFPGHISCDPASNSELVVPLIYQNNVYGVLDIDSRTFKRFTECDLKNIEELVEILLKNSDLYAISQYYNVD